jgi:hypothetical protein
MSASCPFCGTNLNFGLKFCVVCGRHTTSSDISRLGGLKTGVKQSEKTRSLDDAISSSDFEKARTKPISLFKHIRSIGEQLFYVFIGLTLFFCATRFTLQNYFAGKVHQILVPLLGKNSDAVERTLTGAGSSEEESEQPETVKPEHKNEPESGKNNQLQTARNKLLKIKKANRLKKFSKNKSHKSKVQSQKNKHSTNINQ